MFSLGQNVAGSPGSRQLSHHLIWGLGLSLKRAFNKKCSGKPLVFWNYFNNENKNNKELVSILSFLLPLGSAQDISHRLMAINTPENSGTVPDLPFSFLWSLWWCHLSCISFPQIWGWWFPNYQSFLWWLLLPASCPQIACNHRVE